MAKNQVTLTFAGDSSDLERSFDRIGSSAKDMGDDVDMGAKAFDRVGESADSAEGRFTGLASGIDGVTTLMDDPSPQEFAQGIADIADGIANFAVPAIQAMSTQLLANIANAASAAAAHAAAAATVVAGWVASGAAALVSGAQMAAAWLIGLGPIGLVIAAIGAIIAILALLGVDFEDVKNAIGAGWAFIKGAAEGVFNWLKTNWPLVLAIITGPIGIAVLVISRHWQTIKDGASSLFSTIKNAATSAKDWIVEKFGEVVDFFQGLPGVIEDAFTGVGSSIVNGIKSVWNSTVGGFGFTVPSWVPGVGGRGFHIPELAQGGIVTRPTLALIGEAGPEAVVPLNRVGSGSGEVNITINVQGSVLSERDLLRVVRDELQRGGFQGMVRAA